MSTSSGHSRIRQSSRCFCNLCQQQTKIKSFSACMLGSQWRFLTNHIGPRQSELSFLTNLFTHPSAWFVCSFGTSQLLWRNFPKTSHNLKGFSWLSHTKTLALLRFHLIQDFRVIRHRKSVIFERPVSVWGTLCKCDRTRLLVWILWKSCSTTFPQNWPFTNCQTILTILRFNELPAKLYRRSLAPPGAIIGGLSFLVYLRSMFWFWAILICCVV